MSVHGFKFFRSVRHSLARALPMTFLFGAVAAFCIGHSWQLVSARGDFLEGFTRLSSLL